MFNTEIACSLIMAKKRQEDGVALSKLSQRYCDEYRTSPEHTGTQNWAVLSRLTDLSNRKHSNIEKFPFNRTAVSPSSSPSRR